MAVSSARVAAVGRTTAAALPRTDLVAELQSAEGLVAVFPAGAGTAVVAQAADGAPTLVDGLSALGWRTSRLDTRRWWSPSALRPPEKSCTRASR